MRHVLVLTAASAALAAACSGSQTPDFAATAPPSPPPLTCEPFAADAATALLTDSATGRRRVEGQLGKAVSVQATPPGPGGTVYVIAMDVSGKAVVLVHPVTATPPAPTAQGPYGALTSYTEQATGFAQDAALERRADGGAVSLAVECLSR